MDKVLIGLERSKFIQLYKYDSCHITQENIIGKSLEEIKSLYNFNKDVCCEVTEIALPIFEQEHEVIFIEYIQDKIKFNSGIELNFMGVLQVIPLTPLAKDLLSTKLNSEFIISDALPKALFDKILIKREDKIRNKTGFELLNLFNLPAPNLEFVSEVRKVTSYKVIETKDIIDKSSLFYLIDFDRTPSFIPEGNVEGLIKLACVAMIKGGRDISLVPKGPFYKTITSNASSLNKGNILDAYLNFNKIVSKLPEGEKSKIDFLNEILKIHGINLNLFLIYYLFFTFKKVLQKKEFNLLALQPEIDHLRQDFSIEVANTLYLLGYTFSFSSLFESIQKIRKAPIFGLTPIPLDKFTKEETGYKTGESVVLKTFQGVSNLPLPNFTTQENENLRVNPLNSSDEARTLPVGEHEVFSGLQEQLQEPQIIKDSIVKDDEAKKLDIKIIENPETPLSTENKETIRNHQDLIETLVVGTDTNDSYSNLEQNQEYSSSHNPDDNLASNDLVDHLMNDGEAANKIETDLFSNKFTIYKSFLLKELAPIYGGKEMIKILDKKLLNKEEFNLKDLKDCLQAEYSSKKPMGKLKKIAQDALDIYEKNFPDKS